MLALLNELRQALGWRGFAAILAVAVVSVLALDFTTNARSYFEMYIQSQNAQWAAVKAKADAERAASEAKKAEHEAVAAKALADKADADARTAKQVAENAAQAQKGVAEKSEGEGKNAQAIGHYAELRAAAEAREKAALAEKALYDAQTSAGEAAINNAIARSMGLPVPNVEAPTTQPQPAHRYGTLSGPGIVVDAAVNPKASKQDDVGLTARMSRCTMPQALSGRKDPRPECYGLDRMTIASADASNDPSSDVRQPKPNNAAQEQGWKPAPSSECAKWLRGFHSQRKPSSAFAVGQSGNCGWAMGKRNARAIALRECAAHDGQNCRVIAEQ